MSDDIVSISLILIITFLVSREFVTWYWKQNKIVSLLESINNHLEKLTDQLPEKPDDENEQALIENEDVINKIKR